MTLLITKVGEFVRDYAHTTTAGTKFVSHKVAVNLLPVIGKSDLPLGVQYSMWIPESNTAMLSLARALISGNAFDPTTNESYNPETRLAFKNPTSDFELAEIKLNVKDGVTYKNQTIWLKDGIEADWDLGMVPITKLAGNIAGLMTRVAIRKSVVTEVEVPAIVDAF